MFAKYKYVMALVLASIPSAFGNFADSVVWYDHGTAYAVSFSGVPYTNPSAALGQPNRDTSFGPVQPFNPPFEVSEIVSIGVGGSLVLHMSAPVLNSSASLFGMDFVLYGSAGFVDVDYPNGRTDSSASLFGDNPGSTRILSPTSPNPMARFWEPTTSNPINLVSARTSATPVISSAKKPEARASPPSCANTPKAKPSEWASAPCNSTSLSPPTKPPSACGKNSASKSSVACLARSAIPNLVSWMPL